MDRFLILFLSLCLFVPTAGPAMSDTGGQADPGQGSFSTSRQRGIQLAQGGDCESFGKANNCKAIRDRRSKSCVCAGA
jgi:hypothetical protein